ncbi:hypothetical protein GJ496_009700 [Pomphorhynchus laevis]|nr:hypothetical protein GJ496_009700 [Pomphorhynchus laevis]
MPLASKKFAKSDDRKGDPLSYTISCGMPKRANISLNLPIVSREQVHLTGCTSGHIVYGSIAIRNQIPLIGPAKSTYNRFQAALGRFY